MLSRRELTVGNIILVLMQVGMLVIMIMTPVHMGNHRHSLRTNGLVIGFHIAVIYLFPLLTSGLIDKFGRIFIAIIT